MIRSEGPSRWIARWKGFFQRFINRFLAYIALDWLLNVGRRALLLLHRVVAHADLLVLSDFSVSPRLEFVTSGADGYESSSLSLLCDQGVDISFDRPLDDFGR